MSEAKSLKETTGLADTEVHELPTATVTQPATRRIRAATLLVAIPAIIISLALFAYLNTGRFVSTENAYLKSHIVNVSAEVSGTITKVPVEENQHVNKGDALFYLDDQPFHLALQRANALLEQVESEIESDKLAYLQALSERDLYQSTADFAATQLARQQGLINASLGKKEDLDTAQYELNSAKRRAAIADQNAITLLARLKGDPEIPVDAHPRWQAARADRDTAKLDLQRATVRAPFSGMVTNRPEPGDYVERGSPVTAIVASDHMWVEANFKETQMTHIKPGQVVEFNVDAYPGSFWHGRIESISRSTGAEFALLPPQNATGNWVKIVQRIPVRIEILDSHKEYELRAGMSSTVTVDTVYNRQWRDLVPDW